MSAPHAFTFRLLPESLAICRLPADAPLPAWPRGPFVCVTRTPDELSIVCDEHGVPADVQSVRGRRALGIAGTVDFSTIGVIAGLTRPLADAGVSVFVVLDLRHGLDPRSGKGPRDCGARAARGRSRRRGIGPTLPRILSVAHGDDQPVAQVETQRARRGEQRDLQGGLNAYQVGVRWNEKSPSTTRPYRWSSLERTGWPTAGPPAPRTRSPADRALPELRLRRGTLRHWEFRS